MPSFNQITAYADRMKAESADRDASRQRTSVEVGRMAQQLTTHPGWSLFVEAVTAMKANAVKSRQGEAEVMGHDATVGDALAKAKIRYGRADAACQTLDAVLDLIPRMIAKGEEAIKSLRTGESPNR